MERNIRLNWSDLVNEAIKRRKQQNLTQKQLAVLVGISGPTINNFEQGKATVTLDSCLKILRFLGLLDENTSLYDEILPINLRVNPCFLNLKTSHDFREKTEKAFRFCQPYLDKNFKKQFPLEDHFFSRLWELFVCNALIQSKAANLLQRTGGKGPDFRLKNFSRSKDLYIECVCPQDAKDRGLVQNEHYFYSEEKRGKGKWVSTSRGYDDFTVSRYSSSLHDKSEKFKKSYQYTEGHYRVLCVSGYVLSQLKGKRHGASDTLSTKEDFDTVIRGKREHFFSKNGEVGFKDQQAEIQKGNTTLTLGHHEDLEIFDAIIFSDYFPFLTPSDDFYKIWFKENASNELVDNLEELF